MGANPFMSALFLDGNEAFQSCLSFSAVHITQCEAAVGQVNFYISTPRILKNSPGMKVHFKPGKSNRILLTSQRPTVFGGKTNLKDK